MGGDNQLGRLPSQEPHIALESVDMPLFVIAVAALVASLSVAQLSSSNASAGSLRGSSEATTSRSSDSQLGVVRLSQDGRTVVNDLPPEGDEQMINQLPITTLHCHSRESLASSDTESFD